MAALRCRRLGPELRHLRGILTHCCAVAARPHLQPIPAVLEIPSKDCPYDPSQDSLLTRVKHIAGFN
jgi:hypothetical protein